MSESEAKVLTTQARHAVNARTVIRAKSPLRISFVGGGTDLPHYYREHGGAVLSSTVNMYSHVTLTPREDHNISIRSLDFGQAAHFKVNEEPEFDGVLDLAKAAVRRMGTVVGAELDVYTQAPAGSGLGGSSAVTSAIIGALSEFTGVVMTPYEFAELNYRIEREDLGIGGGKQDQYATTFGGFNVLEFLSDRVIVTPLRVSPEVLNDLECHLMLCYTGKVRPKLGLIDKQVRLYMEGRQSTHDAMKRIHAMVFEMKEALLRGSLYEFGKLLHQAYENKRQMNPHASDRDIDALYQLALDNGAIGGKLCGAGGGGYLLLFVEAFRRNDVRQALENAGGEFTDFSFDDHGLQVWRSTCR